MLAFLNCQGKGFPVPRETVKGTVSKRFTSDSLAASISPIAQTGSEDWSHGSKLLLLPVSIKKSMEVSGSLMNRRGEKHDSNLSKRDPVEGRETPF